MTNALKSDASQARVDRSAEVRPVYLESLTLVGRLHRRLLDVIKDEFDRRGRSDVNSVRLAEDACDAVPLGADAAFACARHPDCPSHVPSPDPPALESPPYFCLVNHQDAREASVLRGRLRPFVSAPPPAAADGRRLKLQGRSDY